ncbi:melanotransferrin-like [Penaeus chinensis]|uniref:melanotransferrin-like n=1 Tax=Penaeus chinensis TaxID=139456 RepID=UPI001FB6C537|nr:melanotransferrin-like [Penaeus chinensis]XP_047480254.1 melanotransferrin-like [Penaeus chinensis]
MDFGWGQVRGISNMRVFLFLFAVLGTVAAGSQNTVRWCTVSPPEQRKCEAFAKAIERDALRFEKAYSQLECLQHSNHDECMVALDKGFADLVVLDPNEIFIAGRYHSLVPIMKEVYENGLQLYYSVAFVKKGNLTSVKSLEDLRGTTACFPSVASMGGWVMPIAKLIRSGAMKIIDCNNHIKSASAFFGGGCAVNILSDKYNPLGDNNQILCSACGSDLPGRHCTSQDIYAGHQGAINCLLDKGDIAFARHTSLNTTLEEYGTELRLSADDFELLCEDGSRAAVTDYETCNWGTVPSNAIVTTSAKSPEQRRGLQDFLKTAFERYGKKSTNSKDFYLFDSFPKYGKSYDLLFSDNTQMLVDLSTSQQNFQKYLVGNIMNHIQTIRSCPVNKMTLCVTSQAEFSKCLKMRTALHAQLLKPEMECFKGDTNFDCMGAIKRREADVVVFEAGDIYSAGLNYELVPFMGEQYNLDTLEYYVVAVSKEDDPDTDVLYLKNKRTCHPAVMHGGGWVVPLAYLINNNLIRQYGCNSVRAASEYFEKSCAPGSLSRFYRHNMNRLNLCHLCHGIGSGFCARDHSEPYYGFTGAFRCLVEGGGDIAFLKHTTVRENVDGKRKQWWARNQLTADYQLVCRDGTRASVTDYQDCNLGTVRSNAVVTRGGYLYNETEVAAYTNLLLYAQQHFGRDSDDEWNFKMFHSDEPYADLIFQDATQQLVPLEKEEQHYHPYLGIEFLNARYEVDCTASSPCLQVSSALMAFLVILCLAN